MPHKVLYVPRWILLGANGTAWLPNVSLVADDLPTLTKDRVIRNEGVHQLQQDELGYLPWVFCYLKAYVKLMFTDGLDPYKDNPFEVDSRIWDDSEEKFNLRPPRYWERAYKEMC